MFDSSKIQKLYIGSRLLSGTKIIYPIEYLTIPYTNDSIIRITDWDEINQTVTIGNQIIQLNEVINTGENITYSEEQTINSNGKTYVKTITFSISGINVFLVNQLKEFTITTDGKAGLAPTIAFLIDDNDQKLVIGYDKPLLLETTDYMIGEDNQVNLSYISKSQSRSRAYQLL